jgi:hypothetical protein
MTTPVPVVRFTLTDLGSSEADMGSVSHGALLGSPGLELAKSAKIR